MPKSKEENQELLRKREEKLETWRKLEEEQRKDQELNPNKCPKKTEDKEEQVKSETKRPQRSAAKGHLYADKEVPEYGEEDEENFIPEGFPDDMDFFKEATSKMLTKGGEKVEQKDEVKEEIPAPEVKMEVEDDGDDDDDDDDEDDIGDNDDGDNQGQSTDEEDEDDDDDEDFKPSGSSSPVPKIAIKFDPENPPANLDWRQFCHEAGPEEKVEKKYTPRMRETRALVDSYSEEAEEGSLLCNLCGKAYSNEWRLGDHIKKTHTQQFIPCPECGTVQRNLFGLRQHLQRHHKFSPPEAKAKSESIDLTGIESTVISKTKKNAGAAKSAPRQRMKKEDALEEVLCDLCVTAGKPPKVYTRRSLTAHVKNWHDAGTYLCVTCGSSFALFGQLRNHNNSHHSFQANHPKPCPHCGKLVKCVKRHVKDVHGEKEECVCPQCARVGRLVSCSLLNVTFIAGVLRNGPAACAREAHAR